MVLLGTWFSLARYTGETLFLKDPMPNNSQPHPLEWLLGESPGAHLSKLHKDGLLARVLPEVAALYGVPQPEQHHPEVCTGRHIELCLDRAHALRLRSAARVAVLLHDLGKGLTPHQELPHHRSHESAGVPLVRTVCDRLALSSYERRLSLAVCEWHLHAHRLFDMRPASVVSFVAGAELLQSPEFWDDFAGACEADATGRAGLEQKPYPNAKVLRAVCADLASLEPYPEDRATKSWQAAHAARLAIVQRAKALAHD